MKQLTEGQRLNNERFRGIQANAVRSDLFDCGCVKHTDARGKSSVFLHRDAMVGHQPSGRTRDQKAVQKALREARTQPKTTINSSSALSAVQSEIRRVVSKGESKTLAEDKYLKQLHRQAEKLNLEAARRDLADVGRGLEKIRSRRAERPETIDVMRATKAELRDRALDVIERDGGHLEPHQLDAIDALVRNVTEYVNPVTICRRLAHHGGTRVSRGLRKGHAAAWWRRCRVDRRRECGRHCLPCRV
jgi:hypothetical protein